MSLADLESHHTELLAEGSLAVARLRGKRATTAKGVAARSDIQSADDILALIGKVDGYRAEGMAIPDAAAAAGVDELAYHRCRTEYGALHKAQITRLRRLEAENARLRQRVTELMIDKLQLEEASWSLY